MRLTPILLLAVGFAFAKAEMAHATQPPDPVGSDIAHDTAVGSGALDSLNLSYRDPNGVGTQDNTATGASALAAELGGFQNSAFGAQSLLQFQYGNENSGFGASTLDALTTGNYNTALGSLALTTLATGDYNTAVGFAALNRATASANTAVGAGVLQADTTGTTNTGVGTFALTTNVGGSNNTAVGDSALFYNTSGSDNTAVGFQALFYNSSGTDNTAMGFQALFDNKTGQQNMAFGRNALRNNSSGSFNAAMGYSACWSCRNGNDNVAYGFKSLYSNETGSGNIVMGYSAGYNIVGSNNIEIGNAGFSTDSGTIRIGSSSQTAAYVAGVSTTHLTGAAVYVSSSGQLGVLASSERYKTEIQSLESSDDKLLELRPVTFHLKTEPNGTLQYGLIAEEVEKIYPDLVIRDDQGQIQGVRYDELTPLLLKEVQEQSSELQQLRTLRSRQRDIETRMAALQQQNEAILAELHRRR